MKIHEYNEMMSYLTRPAFNGGGSTKKPTLEDLKQSGQIKTATDYKPKKPKIIQLIRDFEERNPRTNKAIGGGVIEGEDLGTREGFSKVIRKGTSGEFKGLFSVRAMDRSAADNIPGAVKFGPEAVYFEKEKDAKNFIKNFDKYKKIPIRGGTTPSDDPARLKRIDDYVKDFEKKYGKKPTAKNIRTQLKEQRRVIPIYEQVYGKLPTGSGAKLTNVEKDIVKILNNKKIIEKLDAGKFPTITDISRITGLDVALSETRLVDLAEKLRENPKYKKIADDYLDQPGITKLSEGFGGRKRARSRAILENRFVKLMGLDKKLPSLRTEILRKIQSFIPELKGLLAVDEIAGITTSMRRGSGPYAIFGQVLGGDFNTNVKGHGVDRVKGQIEKQLIDLDKNDPQRKILAEKYNQSISSFEKEANKNNPAKKVRGLKLSFKPPSETIKNKKIYNQYKDLFDAHYEKYGYSFEVPADRDSLVDISKKLDNKSFQNTVKNRFKNLINKGGKVGAGIGLATLAGTGFALADEQDNLIPGVLPKGSPGQINQEKSLIEEYPMLTGTAAAAAPLATKTGRKVYGALAKPLLSGALKTIGSVPVSAYLAGKELSKEDPNYSIAGLELLLPELGKRVPGSGTGILSKVGRFAVNPIGRLARSFTPVGLGLQGVQLVNEAMKEQRRINEMRETDPEAYQQFIADQEDILRQSAAYGGRMGFADGPEDPSKRKTMKILGGLATLPLVGRFFDVAQVAAPTVSRAFDSMPDFLTDLIAKVKAKAEATGMKFFTGKSADEFADVYKADGYTVTEQGNRVTVTKRKEQGDMLEKDMEMELEVDPETGGMTYKEATARPDAEGKLKDVEESIDDIDLEEMKKYTYDE